MKIVLLQNYVDNYFSQILYLSNTHRLYDPLTRVPYAWMNGYSTLLHNIAPGNYIVIKVEYRLLLYFKIFFFKNKI